MRKKVYCGQPPLYLLEMNKKKFKISLSIAGILYQYFFAFILTKLCPRKLMYKLKKTHEI